VFGEEHPGGDLSSVGAGAEMGQQFRLARRKGTGAGKQVEPLSGCRLLDGDGEVGADTGGTQGEPQPGGEVDPRSGLVIVYPGLARLSCRAGCGSGLRRLSGVFSGPLPR
jgi:hypothetical protein